MENVVEKTTATLQITKILSIANDVRFSANEYILEEGKENQNFYILMRGEVEIIKKTASGQDKVIAHLKSGEFFGEGSLSGHLIKPASARAITDVQLMAVSYEDFDNLIKSDSATGVEFLQAVLGAVNDRLNYTNIKLLALYEVNKLMSIYRDDLNNLGKALVEKLLIITESKDGVILLRNPFSDDYRVVFSTSGDINEKTFEGKSEKELTILDKDGHQYLYVSLNGYGVIALRRDPADSKYEDDQLRLLGLVADQATNTIESASRRASDKAKNILHQKKFVL